MSYYRDMAAKLRALAESFATDSAEFDQAVDGLVAAGGVVHVR